MAERTARRAPVGARPSQVVAGKILRTERTIELEIERHGGTYPHNNGCVDEAEVCRRAGVAPIALTGIAHSTGTRVQLTAWLRRVAEAHELGLRRRVAVSLAPLQDEQRELIASRYRNANMEVEALRLRVDALEERREAIVKRFAVLDERRSRRRVGARIRDRGLAPRDDSIAHCDQAASTATGSPIFASSMTAALASRAASSIRPTLFSYQKTTSAGASAKTRA